MDLSGLQKLQGRDIRASRFREGLSAPAFHAGFHPVSAIDAHLTAAWSGLAREASEPNVFYEHWFLRPGLAQFAPDAGLRLFLLWAGEAFHSPLLGLLPLGPASHFGRWPVAHVQNWMHHNCFLGTPLVRRGHEQDFWEQLLVALDESDWPGFLHINGITIGGPLDQAMRAVCGRQKRRCDLVHSEARALLQSSLGPEAYLQATVRGKKRKELRRQAKRLDELGDIQFNHQTDDASLDRWIDEFLELERRGWKGFGGSALDSAGQTREFFRAALVGAAQSGQLERLDIRLAGAPLVMLVNFHSGQGSFSFKTAFDEAFARFSPGVLLQLENLRLLDNPAIAWMDSCAAENHSMIDSLWAGRRHIGRFSIELQGVSRRAVFRGLRLGEDLMGKIRGRTIFDPTEGQG